MLSPGSVPHLVDNYLQMLSLQLSSPGRSSLLPILPGLAAQCCATSPPSKSCRASITSGDGTTMQQISISGHASGWDKELGCTVRVHFFVISCFSWVRAGTSPHSFPDGFQRHPVFSHADDRHKASASIAFYWEVLSATVANVFTGDHRCQHARLDIGTWNPISRAGFITKFLVLRVLPSISPQIKMFTFRQAKDSRGLPDAVVTYQQETKEKWCTLDRI